jgi:OmcA/MtrC family decaheme c-type cytochrome
MKNNQSAFQWFGHFIAASLLALGLAGCSGDDGSPGVPGAPGPGVAPKETATAMTITVTGVSINSAPVVNFKVTNQDGVAVAGLVVPTDLYFTIAKLVPGSNGAASGWQNYINVASRSGLPYIRGNRENNGTLVDNKDGTYSYTFSTNITDTTKTCPALPANPCKDANGNTIDTSYNASLTHRVGIQTRGSLPVTAGVYTFIPGAGAVASGREIVAYAKCNECHNKLVAHDARADVAYCVTCHNPGSTAPVSDGATTGPGTIDLKVMVHKIHHGDELPSVKTAGFGDYAITGFSGPVSFKEVAFPQDIRNCTKCHDGTPGATNITAQGDNWKNAPNRAACSSCHDDVAFTAAQLGNPAYKTVDHPTLSGQGDMTDDSLCSQCHSPGKAEDVVVKHTSPLKVARGNFKFNILEICGVPVATTGAAAGTANTTGVTGCKVGEYPTVAFSVTNPKTGTAPGTPYNIFADPAFWGTSAPVASLTVDIAWNTNDYTNQGGSQARPGRADQFSVYGTTAATNPYGNEPIPAYPAAVPHPTIAGAYLLTAATPIPVAATGTAAVALEGRAYSTVADPGLSGSAANRIPIKGEVAYFSITATPKARRVVADATGKCDACHDQLSLHGGNRNDNVQLCVLCHNPSNTDAQASARPKWTNHLPIGDDPAQLALLVPPGVQPSDKKKEESVDLRRMIHGIHAGEMRENAINVAGTTFGFTFPGHLNDCSTCHAGTSYQLTGIWETPTQTGNILGSTIDSAPKSIVTVASTAAAVDLELDTPANDLKISPIAAVCSSCHDGDLQKQHMLLNGAGFGVTQAQIGSTYYETCAICHGPGTVADVKVVHGVP